MWNGTVMANTLVIIFLIFNTYRTMLEISIIGHVGRDAVLKNKNGQDFVAFSIAHTDRQKVDTDTGEELRKEKTYWVSVTTRQLNLAEFIKKGTQLFIRGRLSTNIYKDDDNQNQVGIKCSADYIQLLGSSKKEKEEKETAEA